ncbi:hypothetical protein DPEC_G00367550 [Dallia pectoralis]|nr:hypothetical protein DPEC_G00367550 [Dallia pectoralis]
MKLAPLEPRTTESPPPPVIEDERDRTLTPSTGPTAPEAKLSRTQESLLTLIATSYRRRSQSSSTDKHVGASLLSARRRCRGINKHLGLETFVPNSSFHPREAL